MNNGNFAIYKGREYKASGRGNKIALYSNAEDVKKGFTKCLLGDKYELVLDREEVDSYFSRNCICNYKDDDFLIISENEKQYLFFNSVGVPYQRIYQQSGFKGSHYHGEQRNKQSRPGAGYSTYNLTGISRD